MTTTADKFRPAATSAMERANVPSVCECCGREDLKKTVKVTNGATTMWMGTGCAAKACGVGIKDFGKALKAEQDQHDAAERKAHYNAVAAERARWQDFLNERAPQFRGDIYAQERAVGRDGWREFMRIDPYWAAA